MMTTSRLLAAVIALAGAGCATTAPIALHPIDVPRPVPVACLTALPDAPDGVARTVEDERRILGSVPMRARGEALDLQRRLWRAYALDLEAALKPCIQAAD